MSFFNMLKDMDKKFSFSFIGVILSLVFGIFGIYIGVFYEQKPDIDFKIKSSFSALEIRENIKKLEIYYNETKISKSTTDLRIIEIEIKNSGSASILKDFYDDKAPFGFRVLKGVVSESPVITRASNGYLRSVLKVSLIEEKALIYKFSEVILEPGDFFVVKLIITHKRNEDPKVLPMGIIASVDEFNYLVLDEKEEAVSFLSNALSGGGWLVIFKLVFFGFIFIFLLIVIGLVLEEIGEYREKRYRKKIMKIYHDFNNSTPTALEVYREGLYLKKDYYRLLIQHLILKCIVRTKSPVEAKVFRDYGVGPAEENTQRVIKSILDELESRSVITLSGDNLYEIDGSSRSRLNMFHSHLMKHDEGYQARVASSKLRVSE